MSDSFATPWTVARQASPSMGFSGQEYCSGLPCPSPGDLPDPGIKPSSPVSPALGGGVFTTERPPHPLGQGRGVGGSGQSQGQTQPPALEVRSQPLDHQEVPNNDLDYGNDVDFQSLFTWL